MTARILFFFGLLSCVFLPNLLWLNFSTARILNGEPTSIDIVIVHVNQKTIALGSLEPGEHRFLFLPKSGDATFFVTYRKGSESERACTGYVEGDMYHVEAQLMGADTSRCSFSLPLLSELFILKWI